MVLDASGQISKAIELRDHAAKKGSGRVIPMHPALADALSAWRGGFDRVVGARGPGPSAAGRWLRSAWSSGSSARMRTSGWTGARPIPGAGPWTMLLRTACCATARAIVSRCTCATAIIGYLVEPIGNEG